TRQVPLAVISSMFGNILVSTVAVWLSVATLTHAAGPEAAAPHQFSSGSSSQLFRLRPFPPAQTGLPSPLTARLLLCLEPASLSGFCFDEGVDLRLTPHIGPRAAASG
ncbi:MAG: hypothetical protein ACREC3_03400, partial [Methyloceanibacter sp.]